MSNGAPHCSLPRFAACNTIGRVANGRKRNSGARDDAGNAFRILVSRAAERKVGGKPDGDALLLDIPLVLGRDRAGRPFAIRDVCPHRGIPLSFGQLEAANVECAYHGWQFDVHSGQCAVIPSLTADSKLKCDRIYAGRFPCEERDGYIWVFMPKWKERAPAADAGLQRPKCRNSASTFTSPISRPRCRCSVDHGIIGLMDPAHGPFVHQAWWWRSRHSIHEKRKEFEPIPNGFRMSPHTPSSNSAPYKMLKAFYGAPVTTTIDFVLPNMRFEQTRAARVVLEPHDGHTYPPRSLPARFLRGVEYDAVGTTNGCVIAHTSGRDLSARIRRLIEKQSMGLKHRPKLMLIDDADRQAKWYFDLKAAYLESRRTGPPMVHPMDGPVTLHWRS